MPDRVAGWRRPPVGRVQWGHLDTGERDTRAIGNVFLITGAEPHTAWLNDCLLLDDKKFVKTGADLLPDELR